MKYTVEITSDRMVRKFIDDNGNEYVNTFVIRKTGVIETLELSIIEQLKKAEIKDEELLDAIYFDDLDDIWAAIRNR